MELLLPNGVCQVQFFTRKGTQCVCEKVPVFTSMPLIPMCYWMPAVVDNVITIEHSILHYSPLSKC